MSAAVRKHRPPDPARELSRLESSRAHPMLAGGRQDAAVRARYGFAAGRPRGCDFGVAAEREPSVTVGRAACRRIEDCLSEAGTPLDTFRAILDFGGGCGRVTFWMEKQMAPEARLHGTDTDQEAVAW